MTRLSEKSINISVSPRLYSELEQISKDHDILSNTDNPKVTSTAREILRFFCTINRIKEVTELKEKKGMTLKDLFRRGIFSMLGGRGSR